MKNLLLIMLFGIYAAIPASAQETVTDEYVQHAIGRGRQYIIVILKDTLSQKMDEMAMAREQEEHLRYLFTLKEQGKLPIFGPFFNSGELQGLCIFNSDNLEEVRKLIREDPHVKAGHMTYEIHQWFSIPGFVLP